ncbi:MAG: hypothetical protein JXI32_04495 [Deltaproteobacteria bacterium]|nr:hypothetical protein [Deltaproteobacteria bacterium]
MAKNLLRFFKDICIKNITPAMISDYKIQRRNDEVTSRTINYELTLMSHAFNLAILEWEWARDSPVRKAKKDRGIDTLAGRYLRGTETGKMEDSLNGDAMRSSQHRKSQEIHRGYGQV